jgi:DNA-binding SARP family transcriptional activator/tetratricopeptide (TPR) repeat protein
VDRLLSLLWEDEPPDTAAATIHTHVARLRSALDPDRDGQRGLRLTRVGDGYLAEVRPGSVDAARFREQVERARVLPGAAVRAAALRAALDLWRGPLLSDVASDRLRERIGTGWEELRLSTAESWVEAELEAGRHELLIPELSDLVRDNPLRERLTRALMLALYRAGRQADALAAYQRVRVRLADEFGLEAGPELRRLQEAVLRDDPSLDLVAPAAEPSPTAERGAVPAQLPARPRNFIGREDELALLDRSLTDRASATPVVISAIAGTAGVGKTALALHWAHRVADQFPDGQLYLNLRGFDPANPAMTTAEAVRRFLDAFAVPPQRIPAVLDGQLDLYRSLLADRRVLVVLDNARDAEQVRPLLPGSAGNLAILTSRSQLASLVAIEGARLLTLDLMPDDEARLLLEDRLGRRRTDAEPAAVTDLIARCAGLPLALAIVAARAVIQPDLGLGRLAEELRDRRGALEPLPGGDRATDLRAVFSWSYARLSPSAARLFRLLGTHPGPGIGRAAVAGLLGEPPERVQPALAELAEAHLISEPAPGRYGCHDLLRAYAAELAVTVESDVERRAALTRVLDHYLHTAHRAALLLDPHRDPLALPPPAPGAAPVEIADAEAGLAWFIAEYPTLLAAIPQAGSAGLDRHAWQLAFALTNFLDRLGLWPELIATHETALAAAGRLDDQTGQAHALRGLARAYTRTGRYADAYVHLDRTLSLFEELGDVEAQARTHLNLGQVYERQGRLAEALPHAERALELYLSVDHRVGQARALNNIGWSHVALGQYEQAVASCERAIELHLAAGNRIGAANTWDTLGYAQHHLGRYPAAIDCYRRALELFRAVGDRYNEAEALNHLGDAESALGDGARAKEAWQGALSILDDLGHADADRIRAKLT